MRLCSIFRPENCQLSRHSSLDSKLPNKLGRNVVSTVCQAPFSHPGRGFSRPKPTTLDFSGFLTDTRHIALVPPLPVVGDVQPGWVLAWTTYSPCPSRSAVTHIKGEFFSFGPPDSPVEERA